MKYLINYLNDEIVDINDFNDLIKEIKIIKSKIDENPKKWGIIKKIINDYEYIYTSPDLNKNIADIYPFSRSYFKMKEIVNTFELLKDKNNIFCIAEAPGGFIQCFLENDNNKIVTTSLLSKNRKIPYWNKKIIKNKNIKFDYGIKKNGDIFDISNLLSMIKDKKNYFDIITADGGFDYSGDYNNQEKDSLKLIHNEIFLALNTQKEGGSFICKFFDIYLKETIFLIYLLTLVYDNVYFYKPSISRISNSEKYIICMNYKGYNIDIINILFRGLFEEMECKCPKDFINNIKNINKSYMEKQRNKINEGVELFNKSLKSIPNEEKIKMNLEWCIKNKIKINNNCYYLNMRSSN